MNSATILEIESYLPTGRLTNAELADAYPDWSVEKIAAKTGIETRRIAAPDEYSSDLAIHAANRLFDRGLDRNDVDFVLLCTQSPDYLLPTTACLIQERLKIPTTAGALDFNLGCSGFVYGLGIAKGLIETGQAKHVLLLTAETYSKFLDPSDRSVRTLFGDAAAATWIGPRESDQELMGPFVYGTDGTGAENLIVRDGGLRKGESNSDPFLRMNGSEIFYFTIQAIPRLVKETLAKANVKLNDIDQFVFHQANQFMIEHLRDKIGIPENKFVVALRDCGNTVSSSIPIALKSASETGQIQPGQLVMLVGFGVGYSWGATLVRWSESAS